MNAALKRVLFIVGLAIVAVVLALNALPAQAVGESVKIIGVEILACPGPVKVTVKYDMGTEATDLLIGISATMYDDAIYLTPTGSGSVTVNFNTPLRPGELFDIYTEVSPASSVEYWDVYWTTCDPGACFGPACEGEQPPFLYNVQPIDDPATEAALLATPNDEGVLACGVFDPKGEGTTGWGYKVAYLPGWPECMDETPDLTIMCHEYVEFWYVDQNGKFVQFKGFMWKADHVVGLEISEDGLEYRWTSETDAFCGFFPTG